MAAYFSSVTYVHDAQKARDQMKETLAQLNTQQQAARREVSSLVNRQETALSELAAAMLPSLTPESIEAAIGLSGYRTFAIVNPAIELQKAQHKLGEQIRDRAVQIERRAHDIERLPEFENRLLLRAPRTGTLTREIAELEEFREPLCEVLRRCEHPRMERLLESKYGLPEYSVPFWRLSYFSDWKAGDEIVAKFGGEKTFVDVRSEYLAARDGVAVYDQKLSKLRAEVERGAAIEREHDSLLAEQKALSEGRHGLQEQLAKMPEQFLKEARIQLERYLADLDFVTIGDRLAQHHDVETMAKRYFGLRKQAEYLRQTSTQLLDNSRPALEQTIQKLDREITKYQRPKYASQRISADQLTKIAERNRRSQEVLARQRDAQTAILAFGAYEMGRLDEDFLWWDLITDGKVKASYIDEVARFKALHPTYRYRRPKQNKSGIVEDVDDDDLIVDDDGVIGDAVVAVIGSGHHHERSSDFS